jgi:hypothetical protein
MEKNKHQFFGGGIFMLLEFRATNYRSFREELVFSMKPTKIRDKSYSVLRENSGSKKFSALCSAVIFGPNASGKSNLIGAMENFKSIVLRGHIRNGDGNKQNASACFLELIPNCFDVEHEPISFSITFLDAGTLLAYKFSIDVGGFMESGYPRRIIDEELKVNGKLIFKRGSELEFGSDLPHAFLKPSFMENERVFIEAAKSDLKDSEFFLMSGFKVLVSDKLCTLISRWLETKFIVISSTKSNGHKLVDLKDDSIRIDKVQII